jgi:outer membrane protein assembly factor BamB
MLRWMLCVIAASVVAPTPAAAATQNWEQFGLNPWHSSDNATETAITSANVSQLHLAWAYEAAIAGNGMAQPVVIGSTVITGSTMTSGNGPDNGAVGLSAGSGSQLWMNDTFDPGGLVSIAAGNGMFVEDDDQGEGGVWNVSNGSLVIGVDGLAGGLTVSGDQLLRQYGGVLSSTSETFLSNQYHWNRQVVSDTDAVLPTWPAASGGIVYVTAGSNFAAYDQTTGAKLWDKQIESSGSRPLTSPSLAYRGSIVYFSGNDALYARSATTGRAVWTNSSISAGSMPAVANGTVYVSNNETPVGGLTAINATTGKVLWRNAAAGTCNATPTVAGGVVYDTSQTGDLYAVSAKSGKTLAVITSPHNEFDGYSSQQIVVVNGTVYATTEGNPPNYLEAFRVP